MTDFNDSLLFNCVNLFQSDSKQSMTYKHDKAGRSITSNVYFFLSKVFLTNPRMPFSLCKCTVIPPGI